MVLCPKEKDFNIKGILTGFFTLKTLCPAAFNLKNERNLRLLNIRFS